MPELAAIYFIGLVLCWLLGLILILLWNHKYASSKTKYIQNNLYKIGFAWSESKGELEKLSSDTSLDVFLQNEKSKTTQSTLILTFLLSLLSWFGLMFLFLFMISIRFLAQSRIEKKLYNSPLSNTDCESQEIHNILEGLQINLKPNS